MAQPNDAPAFPPISVIGDQFVSLKPLQIIVERYPCRYIVITNINHEILLKVKPYDKTFHHQRVLLDPNDKPIALLRDKNLSMHSRWNVFRGESKDDSDMILSAKSEHMIQFKTNVSVTLGKSSNDDCDLRIKGSWKKGNCAIYIGDSSRLVAQMQKPETLKHATEKYIVTIQPNMDYAGVVALLAIIDAMENPKENKRGSGGGGDSVGAVLDFANVVMSS